MTILTAPSSSFMFRLAAALRRDGRSSRPVPLEPEPQSEEDIRARRAFLVEMMERNPEAFCSDYDMRTLMQHYPGSF